MACRNATIFFNAGIRGRTHDQLHGESDARRAAACGLDAAGGFAPRHSRSAPIGSLSGGGTAWGLAIKRGAEIAIDEVNKAGGLKVGDKTYKIELLMLDDQYTGQGGKTAAERLVFQDKVKFIVGPIGSNPVLSTDGGHDAARRCC